MNSGDAIWDSFVPADDKAVYDAAGYGERGSLGERPALLVVDVTYGFTGRGPEPVLESARTYPNSCGEAAWVAMPHIALLADTARARGVPVYYTAGVERDASEHAGRWREKHPRTLQQPPDAYDVVDQVASAPGDMLIRKAKPSAFFGTPLVASLIDRGIDTTIIAGSTTSGCVRATVLDSFSYGFSTAIATDAVFDRARVSHAINLFEMSQKYADLFSTEELVDYLNGLSFAARSVG